MRGFPNAWYMFNGLEHTAILSHFLTFITGSRDYCASEFLQPVLVSGASFPVHGILSISDIDLESKYCYFYHSWDFVL